MSQPGPNTSNAPQSVSAPVETGVAVHQAYGQPGFMDVASRFGIDASNVAAYLGPDEQLTGFGSGGSESLVMFVTSPTYGRIVRKVCSEALSSVAWDPNGTGVMAPPSTKGALQVDYLMGLPEDVRPYFPAVFNAKVFNEPTSDGTGVTRKLVYDQGLVDGIEVSTFIADAQPTPAVVAHLHREIMRLLDEKVHSHRVVENVEDTIEPSYLDKIAARLELSRSAAPETFGPLLDGKRIVINGTSYPNITELLTFFRKPEVRDMLEARYHSLVMGDTNTENVMITNPDALLAAMAEGGKPEFTYDDLGIKFIDPRAIGHNSMGADTKDDRMYDNKPVHNTLGNYDVVHGEHFSLVVSSVDNIPQVDISAKPNNPYTSPYEGMADSDYFSYVMDGWNVSSEEFKGNDPNWLLRFAFMMGSHFAAMPPFHFKKGPDGVVHESVEDQKRAIAIFCEGIKWLSATKDMIDGKRQSLYGVPLAPIAPSNR